MLCSLGRLGIGALCVSGLTFSAMASDIKGFTTERSDVIPPLDIFKTMASDLKPEGWITFQALGGEQIISFAPVLSLRCRLKEIKYSIDSKMLDKTFPVPACNPEYPFRVDTQSVHNPYILQLPGGTAQAIAVQLTWDDGTTSNTVYYEPCRAVGAVACAYPLGRN